MTRIEKALMTERARVEARLYTLDLRRVELNASLDRIDAAIDALRPTRE